MKKLFSLLVVFAYTSLLYAQTSFKLSSGAQFQTKGGAYLVLNNASLINNGKIQQVKGDGRVKFTGSIDASLSGNGITVMDSLLLSKSVGSRLNLQSNVSVLSGISFQGGLLNIGNSIVDLRTTGVLNKESETSRANTTGIGYIQASATLNAPSLANPGNLGAIISSSTNLGITTIRRGHAVQSGMESSYSSIQRNFNIIPNNNKTLNATLRFIYFDAELNGLAESSLAQWKSTANSWTILGSTAINNVTNYVEKKNIQSFSQITLAQSCPTITATIPKVYAVKPGGTMNTLYIGYGPTSLTLRTQIEGGVGPYTYRWTAGASNGNLVGTADTLIVKPTSTTIYYLSVVDAYGCSSAVSTDTIKVVDIRCGTNLTNVTVCVYQNGKYTTQCVAFSKVSNLLNNGSYLGTCQSTPPLQSVSSSRGGLVVEEQGHLRASAFPNPSGNYFTLSITGRNNMPIRVTVLDALGRVVESKNEVASNSTVKLGHTYRPGVYFVNVVQGTERITIKLVKQ